ncbi:hypothetical protein [Nocardia africana]|uniref:hypothetical protein n=1 Tax=Nocardia africana TaxID=134964 RepID=UPI000FE225A4|nr:hypothetical protein [Nocardia africana]MCC3313635.1 hypothetical protein [Nocardia africana]
MIKRSLIYSAADPALLAQDRATIVVHRTRSGWQMRYNAYGVVVDGHEVAKLRRGRTVEVSVLPGTHRVELTVNWSVASPSRRVTVSAGQRCYLVNTPKPYLRALATVHSREFLTLDLVPEPPSAAEDIPREGI